MDASSPDLARAIKTFATHYYSLPIHPQPQVQPKTRSNAQELPGSILADRVTADELDSRSLGNVDIESRPAGTYTRDMTEALDHTALSAIQYAVEEKVLQLLRQAGYEKTETCAGQIGSRVRESNAG